MMSRPDYEVVRLVMERHAWVAMALEMSMGHTDLYAPWPTDELNHLLEQMGYRLIAAEGCETHYDLSSGRHEDAPKGPAAIFKAVIEAAADLPHVVQALHEAWAEIHL